MWKGRTSSWSVGRRGLPVPRPAAHVRVLAGDAGRNVKEVQELLGHREFKMTLRYAHLSPDRLRDAVASLEDFSTKTAHGAKIEAARVVSPRRAVSSVGRAPDF